MSSNPVLITEMLILSRATKYGVVKENIISSDVLVFMNDNSSGTLCSCRGFVSFVFHAMSLRYFTA